MRKKSRTRRRNQWIRSLRLIRWKKSQKAYPFVMVNLCLKTGELDYSSKIAEAKLTIGEADFTNNFLKSSNQPQRYIKKGEFNYGNRKRRS